MIPDRVTGETRELLPDYLADARECLDRVSEILLAVDRGQMEKGPEGETLVEELSETSSQIDRVASDLQLAVMKKRLVPIERVVRKLPRMVRDLSRSLQKEIRLETQGENTELDKVVIKGLGGYLADTPGIAGATNRGDGRVTPIVDVNQLLALAARDRPDGSRRAAA